MTDTSANAVSEHLRGLRLNVPISRCVIGCRPCAGIVEKEIKKLKKQLKPESGAKKKKKSSKKSKK